MCEELEHVWGAWQQKNHSYTEKTNLKLIWCSKQILSYVLFKDHDVIMMESYDKHLCTVDLYHALYKEMILLVAGKF